MGSGVSLHRRSPLHFALKRGLKQIGNGESAGHGVKADATNPGPFELRWSLQNRPRGFLVANDHNTAEQLQVHASVAREAADAVSSATAGWVDRSCGCAGRSQMGGATIDAFHTGSLRASSHRFGFTLPLTAESFPATRRRSGSTNIRSVHVYYYSVAHLGACYRFPTFSNRAGKTEQRRAK